MLIEKFKNPVLLYQAIMCLRAIVYHHEELEINYGELIPKITPVALSLLNQFFSPNILWPIIHIITLLIERS